MDHIDLWRPWILLYKDFRRSSKSFRSIRIINQWEVPDDIDEMLTQYVVLGDLWATWRSLSYMKILELFGDLWATRGFFSSMKIFQLLGKWSYRRSVSYLEIFDLPGDLWDSWGCLSNYRLNSQCRKMLWYDMITWYHGTMVPWYHGTQHRWYTCDRYWPSQR